MEGVNDNIFKMNDDLLSQIELLKSKTSELEQYLNLEEKHQKIKILEEKVKDPEFWSREKEPAKIQQELAELKDVSKLTEYFRKEIDYLSELLLVVVSDSPECLEISQKIGSLKTEIEKQTQETLLSGKYDRGSALLYLQAGAGGRDSEDWVCLILRMYERYCDFRGWTFKVIDQHFGEAGGPEGRIGIREVALEVKGKFVYGFLKKETGVHRLVRISPFSSKQLRHTSFAKVEVLPKIENIEPAEMQIKPDDLKIETFRSSGPGGQNVNRRETAVRIVHLPTGLQASSQVERYQSVNKKIAMDILIAKLIQRQEQERELELKKIKGEKVANSFGSQIRSYVLHPYKLVKDHRTGEETSDVDGVLNGKIDFFINAEMVI